MTALRLWPNEAGDFAHVVGWIFCAQSTFQQATVNWNGQVTAPGRYIISVSYKDSYAVIELIDHPRNSSHIDFLEKMLATE